VKTIGFLGAGNMAEALIRGLIHGGVAPADHIVASTPRAERRDELRETYGIVTTADNAEVARQADMLVLSVKPQILERVVHEVAAHVRPHALVVSVAAGVDTATIEELLPEGARVVRAMPNVPARIGRGVTAYVASPACTAEDRALVEQLLEPLGSVEPMAAERLMDAVTAVSGSGPAYVFLLAECLAAAAEQEGIDRETALRLASATVAGAGALMLETGEGPSALRKQVTSPGGTTEAALDVLGAADGLGQLLRRAVAVATQRSRELGK